MKKCSMNQFLMMLRFVYRIENSQQQFTFSTRKSLSARLQVLILILTRRNTSHKRRTGMECRLILYSAILYLFIFHTLNYIQEKEMWNENINQLYRARKLRSGHQ